MRIIKILLFFSIFIFLGNIRALCQNHGQSLEMNIPFVSAPVKINGEKIAYYEIHLTNFSNDSIVLKKLEIIDCVDSKIIASFNHDELESKFSLNEKSAKDFKDTLPANASGVIYLEVVLKTDNSDMRLKHRLGAEITRNNKSKLLSVRGADIRLTSKPPIILGAPLGDGFWAAVYDPSWERGHRRVFYTVDGKARLPGRFAIDFIKLDAQGKYAAEDENFVKNWFGYASEVIAVKNGTVASTSSDFSESPTLSEHPKYSPEKAAGNYVSLNIGNHLIAFYEHLKPGSIRVKPGQKVKKGDVIALVGFTGQTTGPHLHFHVADENSSLGAEGVSFAFENFTLLGTYADFGKFGKVPWMPLNNASEKVIFRERPAPNSVIEFKTSKWAIPRETTEFDLKIGKRI